MNNIVIQPILDPPKDETKTVTPVTSVPAVLDTKKEATSAPLVKLADAKSTYVKDSTDPLPPKPGNPFFRGQRAILESNENFIVPPGRYSSTNFAVSITPTKDGKIKYGYTSGKDHEWGKEVDLEGFCGQMTALINVLMRNSLDCVDTYYSHLGSGTDDAVITMSHALRNLLWENFKLDNDDITTPIRDYNLDCDEVTYDFALKLDPDFVPPGIEDFPPDDVPDDYDAEILDRSDKSIWGDDDIVDEFSSAVYHHIKSISSKNDIDEDTWTPYGRKLLTDTDVIGWNKCNLMLADLTDDLPDSPNEFIVGIKDFCSALSDEIFVLVDDEEDMNSPVKKLIALNSVTLYLGLLTFKEIESILDTRCNVIDLRLSKYDYTEIRVAMASCILSFCGINVLDPHDYGSVGTTTDSTTGDKRVISLLEEVEGCIDRAFYYGVIRYLDI